MGSFTLTIRCFGVFRTFGDKLSVSIEPGTSLLQVKEALARQLGESHRSLIDASALANDKSILPKTYVFHDVEDLSILPPVCGG